MMQQKTRKKSSFARWLAGVRRVAKLTQAEAVERMRQLGKAVSVETWSRWESGVRLPPRTKIDAVADTLGVGRVVARRRAGYNVPLKLKSKQGTGILATMLRDLSSDLKSEDRMLRLYAQARAYQDKTDSRFDLEEMNRIARLFDELKNLSPEQRVEAWERIKQIFAAAKEPTKITVPADEAMIFFPKQNWPPVVLGTRVSIEYLDSQEGEVWQSYIVQKIDEQEGKIMATIVATNP
ncbi:MAG TPA: helix-turn-helix transcriptional regulator [Pyrinomonadaceae bacterium]|jgi:transcriptional regulator with XRE-family HTH domain